MTDTTPSVPAPFAIVSGETFQGPQDLCAAYRDLKASLSADPCVRHACKRVRMEMQGQIDAAKRDAEALRGFARDVLEAWPEGGIDGGDLQDFATTHGLLRQTRMLAPCGEHCACTEYGVDFPLECFRRTSLLTGKPESDAAMGATHG